MDSKNIERTINLTIIGRGVEVKKMQKRLRCAARATGTNLHLAWQHQYPQTLNIDTRHSTVVICNDKLVLDGLIPTEDIENLLIQLKEGS